MAQTETDKVSESNPYYYGQILGFPDGTSQLVGPNRPPYVPGLADTYYTVKYGDTTDSIAHTLYARLVETPGRWWWLIAYANNIYEPLNLDELVGVEILIPDVLQYIINRPSTEQQ